MTYCATCPVDEQPFMQVGSLLLCAKCSKALTEFLSAVPTAEAAGADAPTPMPDVPAALDPQVPKTICEWTAVAGVPISIHKAAVSNSPPAAASGGTATAAGASGVLTDISPENNTQRRRRSTEHPTNSTRANTRTPISKGTISSTSKIPSVEA